MVGVDRTYARREGAGGTTAEELDLEAGVDDHVVTAFRLREQALRCRALRRRRANDRR